MPSFFIMFSKKQGGNIFKEQLYKTTLQSATAYKVPQHTSVIRTTVPSTPWGS